jgi:hypothetical protein
MKKRISAGIGSGVIFLAAASLAFATPPSDAPKVKVPNNAVQVSQDVFSLGKAIDPKTGKSVEGYMIVHRKKGEAKNSNASKPGKAPACYGYLAQGAKWKTVEPWVMNAANIDGVDESAAFSIAQNGINKWEDAADGNVGNSVGVDILGAGSTTSAALTADSSAPDGQNELYFGGIDDASAIGVTTVWGYFSGPAKFRELIEWDMVFDDVKFDWATDASAAKMDFDNIATHELGHAAGLADLYNSCTNETMYGYGTEGETKKRDLNTGDIQGINSLY